MARSSQLASLEELDRESEAIDRWYVDTLASLPSEQLAWPRDVRFTGARVLLRGTDEPGWDAGGHDPCER